MHQNRPRFHRLRTRMVAAVAAVVASVALGATPAAAVPLAEYRPSEGDGIEARVTCSDSGVTWNIFVHVEMDGWFYANGTVTNRSPRAKQTRLVLGYFSLPYVYATQSGTDQPAVVEVGPSTLEPGQTQRVVIHGGNSPGVDRWMDELWTYGVVRPTVSSKPRLGQPWHSTTCSVVEYTLQIASSNWEYVDEYRVEGT
ncbi:hypothetical protein [Kineosporia sp. R_H_3]|uniref:hypothetical protein n=1 Tax=Kineosporia sp. R_H_3 TaxID=1961848 RepID=UPI000B4C1E14|nr:hypothetical protein [Kineosporia sp. R_H_3]